jgi:hypothetical protein
MATQSYIVHLIPDAQKESYNRLVAIREGENPLTSINVSQPANASGSPEDPFTHWYGGRWVPDADYLDFYQNVAARIGAWEFPVVADGEAILGDAEAAAAAAAVTISVTTSDEAAQLPQQTLGAVLTAMGLKTIAFE